jgi:NADPH:quinone reductase-like Zn-dependent oxidoreductase
MRALLFTAYGGPEVLEWADAPAPHPGPGQIRFVVPVRTVDARPNPKYFARKRGITWLNLGKFAQRIRDS